MATRTRTAATEPAPRGADEIPFLGSRAASPRFSHAVASATVSTFFRAQGTEDANAGARAHDEGTELNTMYMGHADAVLGFPSWAAFLSEHWSHEISTAYDRQRLAALLTHDEAARYGLSRSLYGLRLLDLLKLPSFAELEKRTLRLHPADGGGTTKFPASAPSLRSVIRRLVAVAATQPRPDEKSAAPLAETNRVLRAVADEDADVAAIKPVAWADANGVHVRVTTTGPRGAAAAVRLYAKLAKLRAK